MTWFIIILLWVFCGIFGAIIAGNRKASAVLGFFLGLFFGPIGLIISALLSPSATVQGPKLLPITAPVKLVGEQSLQNAQYRLWLVNEYAIERNDVLGEVICGERSFATIDDALQYAEGLELAKRQPRRLKIIKSNANKLNAEAEALGISFDGERYKFQTYFYQHLEDALAYAKLPKK